MNAFGYFDLYRIQARGARLALDTLTESGDTEKAIRELRVSLSFCEMLFDHIEFGKNGEAE